VSSAQSGLLAHLKLPLSDGAAQHLIGAQTAVADNDVLPQLDTAVV
jgi:hypothetical protein